MSGSLSPNTQAILLLTAPLIVGRGKTELSPLSPGDYKRLSLRLRELNKEPADLLGGDAPALLEACEPIIDKERARRLLDRGFLLAQAAERWSQRAIWVVSRADLAAYPRRLKRRLKEDAPAVLYGCGDPSILDNGGLAVVGSRKVTEPLANYAAAIGALAAAGKMTLVSGGAKGVDEAAMSGALHAGGRAVGVLANGLEKAVVHRDYRDMVLSGRLVLLSPYDPGAPFLVGHAMQRNKLIYALAEAALVIESDVNKGGTWAGAIEQLDRYRFGPVYVRSQGESSAGLEALKSRGALPWPNPQDGPSLRELLRRRDIARTPSGPIQPELPLASKAAEPYPESRPIRIVETREATKDVATLTPEDWSPAAELFAKVAELVCGLLIIPRTEREIAKELGVAEGQVSAWLKRLVADNIIEKKKKGRSYQYALATHRAEAPSISRKASKGGGSASTA